MMSKQDAKTIYDLLFKSLKEALGDERPDPKILKLALDFCKQFELDVEVDEKAEKDIEDFLDSLPFRKVK